MSEEATQPKIRMVIVSMENDYRLALPSEAHSMKAHVDFINKKGKQTAIIAGLLAGGMALCAFYFVRIVHRKKTLDAMADQFTRGFRRLPPVVPPEVSEAPEETE